VTVEHSIAGPAPSKPSTSRVKPAKPYPEFPLTPHRSGNWCKKIRGKIHYFGKWEEPDAALHRYLDQKDALHAGRKPRPETDALTVKDLANAFLNHKQNLVDTGELSPRTWEDYKRATDELVAHCGKRRVITDLDAEDFSTLRNSMAKKWGPAMLGKMIQCIRCMFKFALENGSIQSPVLYGQGFKRPSKKVMRLQRAKAGAKLFNKEEILRMLEGATTPMRAMILLGINCGFGNADCGNLPVKALDLDNGWVNYPRPKTGVDRRCPLWTETIAAIKEVLDIRPEPKVKEASGLLFVTRWGQSWAKDIADSPVTKEMAKLLQRLNINGRKGLGFYTLRHVFRTIADESKDQPAVDHIMGHESPHMSSVYRETISDERLKAVVDHVHGWLFPVEQGAKIIPFAKTNAS
jgi:integrase